MQPIAGTDHRRVPMISQLHVPLLDATRNLFDAARIAAMKPGAVLINTSRGGIVNEAAVICSAQSGALGGAALDVFTQEPLPATADWADCPDLVLTPHIAGVSFRGQHPCLVDDRCRSH